MKSKAIIQLKTQLLELQDLSLALGVEVCGVFTQILNHYHPATLIGSGKVEEIQKAVSEAQADCVIIDHQLTGIQARNLEKIWKVPVWDRNQVILEIFAQRAESFEGKLQVELAQIMDQLPRMVDAWMGSLSRQGGGIGTKGPGETALEIDRRRARERMKQIRKELKSIGDQRAQKRSGRRKRKIPSFALIGYTNSGKSTLLNKLTNSNVFTQDQLFATLDPTTRKLYLPNHTDVVVTDTVGFISRLPPQFIDAFRATLEESAEADVLLHVIDLSSSQMLEQMEAVNKLIEELGWGEKPLIYVFNKADVAPFEKQFHVKESPRVFISAREGSGITKLKSLMEEVLNSQHISAELFFPNSEEHLIYDLARSGKIIRQEKASSGTVCHVFLPSNQIEQWLRYSTEKDALLVNG